MHELSFLRKFLVSKLAKLAKIVIKFLQVRDQIRNLKKKFSKKLFLKLVVFYYFFKFSIIFGI
jgi:hypothetical protein